MSSFVEVVPSLLRLHPIPNFDHSLYLNDPDLDYEPKFEALSYVWGSEDSEEKLIIILRGGAGGGHLAPAAS